MMLKKLFTISFITVICHISVAQPHEIWVSPNGSDRNTGSKDQPLQTLAMSLRKAREMRRLNDPRIVDGIDIILKGGIYRLDEPVCIRTEDSGTELSPTIIRGADGEKAVISGGLRTGNWIKEKDHIERLPAEAQGKLWSTDIPSVWGSELNFREMWVNGKKAERANTFHDGELDRIIKSDSINEEMWIPVPKISLENSVQLEFIIIQWWTIANLRIKSYDIIDDKVKLTFHQPESRVEFEHPWPMPVDDSADIYMADDKYPFCGNSPFFFANSIELLNQPGEWCRDPVTHKIYYWPRKDENMNTAEVVLPVQETLLQIEGSLDNPVRNITLQDLHFEHTSWLRPSYYGFVPVQDGMYIIDAYKLRPPGTPGNKSLENQGWLGRQSAGISLKGTGNVNFKGCVFKDIGGSGIKIGFYGDLSIEDHLPYDPIDFREVCHHIRIANNLITDCSKEYWDCDGVNVGFAHDIDIEHNDISQLNNSGISVGWGWTGTISCMKNNRVHANNIHHFAKQLYDVAGIYILSAQPNTEISNNCIHHLEDAPYAHLKEHYQYIYLDQNSSYIRVINNWTEKAKFNANANGPGTEWTNNGPQVDEKIKAAAGLEPAYQHLLKEY
jgi:hypothetical protein